MFSTLYKELQNQWGNKDFNQDICRKMKRPANRNWCGWSATLNGFGQNWKMLVISDLLADYWSVRFLQCQFINVHLVIFNTFSHFQCICWDRQSLSHDICLTERSMDHCGTSWSLPPAGFLLGLPWLTADGARISHRAKWDYSSSSWNINGASQAINTLCLTTLPALAQPNRFLF